MPEPRQILLVDDDEGIREVARASLELVGGYEVASAASGQEGLDVSRSNPPDVILLDVMMPGLDGPSTFLRLQEQEETRDVPVVLLTGRTQQDDRSRLSALGVTGVLEKPFDPMTLPGQVAELLGWER